MKSIAFIVLSLLGLASARAADVNKLKLLYVGQPANSTRAKQVTSFLQKNAGQLHAVERRGFRPEQAIGFDVVLLDWPQSGNTEQERKQGSPLGPRASWNKPTVLLGSAGFNMAIVEDRPIAVTPSIFAGSVALPRGYLDRRLRDKGDASEIEWIASQSVLDALKGKDSGEIRKWYAENRGYLHPSWDAKLEVDKEARSLGAAIDTIEFFDKAIAALRTEGAEAKRAFRLLADYAPEGAPKKPSVPDWESWLLENRAFLFFSDQGDYVWYIDPMAKKRGIPTSQLRGPARASQPAKRGSIEVGGK
ncbi:MAG: hypothetical protein FJ403_02170 [Verrucomicrobia bacterium]|nr:hypothetical protein [Verrucomicrobiota bacterium]